METYSRRLQNEQQNKPLRHTKLSPLRFKLTETRMNYKNALKRSRTGSIELDKTASLSEYFPQREMVQKFDEYIESLKKAQND